MDGYNTVDNGLDIHESNVNVTMSFVIDRAFNAPISKIFRFFCPIVVQDGTGDFRDS